MERPDRKPSLSGIAVLLVLAVGAGFEAGCSGEDDLAGPTASFTMSPVCDLVPALAMVSSSTQGDGKIVSYVWDFHDGTSAIGIAPEHRWGATDDSLAVEITLSVTDANGLGDTKTEFNTLTSCLSVTGSSISIAGTAITPHVSVRNDSTDGDALVAFSLDVVGTNGLPLAHGLDGGQLAVPQGQTVDVSSVEPFDCGSDCAAVGDATVVPHVVSTYWCDELTCP